MPRGEFGEVLAHALIVDQDTAKDVSRLTDTNKLDEARSLNSLDHAVNESPKHDAKLIRYADDLVNVCRPGKSGPLYERLKRYLEAKKLKLNETKTRVVDSRRESFRFLGFEFSNRRSVRKRKSYVHVEPARKARRQLREAISRELIHVVDATTVQLIVSCINWAKHRTRKAAAKIHTRISLQSFLPAFVIVGSAGEHDSVRAPELCAALKQGEIVLFDKAYLHFKHLFALAARGVIFVTREKTNLKTRRVKKLPRHRDKRILSDELITLCGACHQARLSANAAARARAR